MRNFALSRAWCLVLQTHAGSYRVALLLEESIASRADMQKPVGEAQRCQLVGGMSVPSFRAVGLCIGVEDYSHLNDMEGAVRDASAVNSRLNATPLCTSTLITHRKVTGSNQMLLRGIRARLQEPGLTDSPPDLFLLFWAGHTIHLANKWGASVLTETKVYLVPAGANPKSEADCNTQCVAMEKVLNILRKDLCTPARTRCGKSIMFLVVLDSSRRVLDCPGELLKCDIGGSTAPLKTAIFCLHTRKETNIEAEHSSCVKALLDPSGIFACNISLSGVLSQLVSRSQDAGSVGHDIIPPHFCISVSAAQAQDTAVELAQKNKDRAKNSKKNQRGSHSSPRDSAGLEFEVDDDIDVSRLPSDMVDREADAFRKQVDHLEEARDLPAILAGMADFSDESAVQEACCWALWFLASDDDHQNLIANAGGIAQVICSMQAHVAVASVQVSNFLMCIKILPCSVFLFPWFHRFVDDSID